MGTIRIDLAEPGGDEAPLRSALGAEGFVVERCEIAEVPRTRADLVVLAGDAPGALEAIRELRDDGLLPDTPVVLLGVPVGTGHRGGGPGFGAELVLLRPVDIAALVMGVRRLLDPGATPSSRPLSSRPEHTLQLSSSETSAVVPAPFAMQGVRPHELALSGYEETGDDPLRGQDDVPPRPQPVSQPPPSAISSAPGTGSGVGSSPGSMEPWNAAAISDALRDLLARADRRVFPARAPIDLSLPGGDEPADVLVPDELLESAPASLDEAEEDPIEQFTFVGGPLLAPIGREPRDDDRSVAGEEVPERKTSPGTPTSMSRRPSAAPMRDELRPDGPRTGSRAGTQGGARTRGRGGTTSPESPLATGIHEARVRPPAEPARGASEALVRTSSWPEEDTVLGRVAPDGSRRGSLGEGGALRLLLRVATLSLDARVTILGDALELGVEVRAGEAIAVEGPVALRAVGSLRARGRLSERAESEEVALALLERRVVAGWMSAYERDRALREAREQLLAEVVATPRATFTLLRREPERTPLRALAAPLPRVLLDAARSLLEPRAVAMLGGPDVGLAVGPQLAARAALMGVAPELLSLIERHEGRRVAELLASAPDERGLPGLLYALVAADALRPVAVQGTTPSADVRPAARAAIEAAARLAEEGDYFSVLGLGPDASSSDVLRAHELLRGRLGALPLEDLELLELAPARDAALFAIDEAARVLSRPRWRELYARALTASGAPVPGLAAPGARR